MKKKEGDIYDNGCVVSNCAAGILSLTCRRLNIFTAKPGNENHFVSPFHVIGCFHFTDGPLVTNILHVDSGRGTRYRQLLEENAVIITLCIQ